jgi:hypothetical protein
MLSILIVFITNIDDDIKLSANDNWRGHGSCLKFKGGILNGRD